MKDPKEEQWDKFIEKLVKEAGLETPAPDFTDKVLSQIGKLEIRNALLVYKPLISRSAWIILAASLAGLVTFSHLGNQGPLPNWLTFVPWDNFTMPDVFRHFYHWSIPGSMLYGTLAISCFIFLQVFLVRHSWDKFYKIN